MNEQALEPVRRARPAWQAVVSLAVFGGLAALVIGLTGQVTAPRIAANERAERLARLHELVPSGSYDNALAEDFVERPVDGADRPAQPVYRARRAGQPVALVVGSTAPDGYAGPIALLVAIGPDGTVRAVRVAAHQETPGIGDFIDRSRSDWINVFSGRSLTNPEALQWQVRSDGGDFDAVAGATVTSRAVIGGVRRALEFQAAEGDKLWQP
jgi:Na+-translocating ferredoxin:NAD+ oxidoreductase subunit G